MAMETDFGWFRDNTALAALVDPPPPPAPGLPRMPSTPSAFPHFVRPGAEPTRPGSSLAARAGRVVPGPAAETQERSASARACEASKRESVASKRESESESESDSESESGSDTSVAPDPEQPAAKRPRTNASLPGPDGVTRGRRGQPRTHRRGVEGFYERVIGWDVRGLRAGTREGVLPAPYTLHPTPCTLHPTPYTSHTTHYTSHPTPYTLHRCRPPPPFRRGGDVLVSRALLRRVRGTPVTLPLPQTLTLPHSLTNDEPHSLTLLRRVVLGFWRVRGSTLLLPDARRV